MLSVIGKPEIIMKKLKLSEHAVIRLFERFNIIDKNAGLNYIKSLLGSSTYLGISACEQGERAHMYITSKIGIYISLDLQHIKSIIKLNEDRGHYIGLKDKIKNYIRQNLIKLKELKARL